jgi:hypothetical protein
MASEARPGQVLRTSEPSLVSHQSSYDHPGSGYVMNIHNYNQARAAPAYYPAQPGQFLPPTMPRDTSGHTWLEVLRRKEEIRREQADVGRTVHVPAAPPVEDILLNEEGQLAFSNALTKFQSYIAEKQEELHVGNTSTVTAIHRQMEQQIEQDSENNMAMLQEGHFEHTLQHQEHPFTVIGSPQGNFDTFDQYPWLHEDAEQKQWADIVAQPPERSVEEVEQVPESTSSKPRKSRKFFDTLLSKIGFSSKNSQADESPKSERKKQEPEVPRPQDVSCSSAHAVRAIQIQDDRILLQNAVGPAPDHMHQYQGSQSSGHSAHYVYSGPESSYADTTPHSQRHYSPSYTSAVPAPYETMVPHQTYPSERDVRPVFNSSYPSMHLPPQWARQEADFYEVSSVPQHVFISSGVDRGCLTPHGSFPSAFGNQLLKPRTLGRMAPFRIKVEHQSLNPAGPFSSNMRVPMSATEYGSETCTCTFTQGQSTRGRSTYSQEESYTCTCSRPSWETIAETFQCSESYSSTGSETGESTTCSVSASESISRVAGGEVKSRKSRRSRRGHRSDGGETQAPEPAPEPDPSVPGPDPDPDPLPEPPPEPNTDQGQTLGSIMQSLLSRESSHESRMFPASAGGSGLDVTSQQPVTQVRLVSDREGYSLAGEDGRKEENLSVLLDEAISKASKRKESGKREAHWANFHDFMNTKMRNTPGFRLRTRRRRSKKRRKSEKTDSDVDPEEEPEQKLQEAPPPENLGFVEPEPVLSYQLPASADAMHEPKDMMKPGSKLRLGVDSQGGAESSKRPVDLRVVSKGRNKHAGRADTMQKDLRESMKLSNSESSATATSQPVEIKILPDGEALGSQGPLNRLQVSPPPPPKVIGGIQRAYDLIEAAMDITGQTVMRGAATALFLSRPDVLSVVSDAALEGLISESASPFVQPQKEEMMSKAAHALAEVITGTSQSNHPEPPSSQPDMGSTILSHNAPLLRAALQRILISKLNAAFPVDQEYVDLEEELHSEPVGFTAQDELAQSKESLVSRASDMFIKNASEVASRMDTTFKTYIPEPDKIAVQIARAAEEPSSAVKGAEQAVLSKVTSKIRKVADLAAETAEQVAGPEGRSAVAEVQASATRLAEATVHEGFSAIEQGADEVLSEAAERSKDMATKITGARPSSVEEFSKEVADYLKVAVKSDDTDSPQAGPSHTATTELLEALVKYYTNSDRLDEQVKVVMDSAVNAASGLSSEEYLKNTLSFSTDLLNYMIKLSRIESLKPPAYRKSSITVFREAFNHGISKLVSDPEDQAMAEARESLLDLEHEPAELEVPTDIVTRLSFSAEPERERANMSQHATDELTKIKDIITSAAKVISHPVSNTDTAKVLLRKALSHLKGQDGVADIQHSVRRLLQSLELESHEVQSLRQTANEKLQVEEVTLEQPLTADEELSRVVRATVPADQVAELGRTAEVAAEKGLDSVKRYLPEPIRKQAEETLRVTANAVTSLALKQVSANVTHFANEYPFSGVCHVSIALKLFVPFDSLIFS